jgi:glutamine amidotransferase
VERLKTEEKLPHVGWNTLDHVRPHPVLEGLEGEAFYFVHTYVVVPRYPAIAAGETTYGVPFVSAIGRQGLVGVQFHPERSGSAGLRLLENFLRFADEEAAA